MVGNKCEFAHSPHHVWVDADPAQLMPFSATAEALYIWMARFRITTYTEVVSSGMRIHICTHINEVYIRGSIVEGKGTTVHTD